MITSKGQKAIAVKCDVTSEAEVKEAGWAAVLAFGDVTILINNAGIVFNKPITEITTK